MPKDDLGATTSKKEWKYANIPVKKDTKKLFMDMKPLILDQDEFVKLILLNEGCLNDIDEYMKEKEETDLSSFISDMLLKCETLDEITDQPQTHYVESHVIITSLSKRFADVIGDKEIGLFLEEAIIYLDKFRGRKLPENRKS